MKLTEAKHDKYDGKAIFVVGPPASGKTTLIKKIIDTFNFKLVDSDTVFERLMGKNNLSLKMDTLKGDDERKKYDLLNTAYEATNKRTSIFINNRIPIILSRTGRLADAVLHTKRQADKNGYDCLLILVDVDVDKAIERNDKRDRSIDSSFVKHANYQFKKNIPILKNSFSETICINTNNITDENLKKYEKEIKRWADK